MSYPTSNWHTLMFSNMEACVLAVALSALLHYPNPGRRTAQAAAAH